MTEKLTMLYRIEGGELDGTEIIPLMGMYSVKYPHRKTKDLYVPPMEANGKKVETFHCCQTCNNPDFLPKDLIEHLKLHAGRLIKRKAGKTTEEIYWALNKRT